MIRQYTRITFKFFHIIILSSFQVQSKLPSFLTLLTYLLVRTKIAQSYTVTMTTDQHNVQAGRLHKLSHTWKVKKKTSRCCTTKLSFIYFFLFFRMHLCNFDKHLNLFSIFFPKGFVIPMTKRSAISFAVCHLVG